MNVLSCFDGMSCGMIALERAGIKVDNYYASEIDKYAIKVSEANYPNIVRLGDVTKVKVDKGRHIDLLIAGSPCQGFSFAGKQLNFEDPRSKLFFEFVRLLKECRMYNPDVKFLLENVKMKKEYQEVINKFLGVEPVFICSSNFSASKRKRLYWTNIDGLTEMKQYSFGLNLSDIVDEESSTESHYLNQKEIDRGIRKHASQVLFTGTKMGSVKFPTPINEKSKCLNTVRIKGDRTMTHIQTSKGIRLLNPVEYERLQTLPTGYTSVAQESQRYKMIGNGWNIDTVAHIFRFLK